MTPAARVQSSRARSMQCGVRELLLPGPDEARVNVYLPGTAFTGGISAAHDDGPQAPRLALPLRLYVEPGRSGRTVALRGHLEAGTRAGRPQLDAEIPLHDMSSTPLLDVVMSGPTTCPDTEQFSGYIITTSPGR